MMTCCRPQWLWQQPFELWLPRSFSCQCLLANQIWHSGILETSSRLCARWAVWIERHLFRTHLVSRHSSTIQPQQYSLQLVVLFLGEIHELTHLWISVYSISKRTGGFFIDFVTYVFQGYQQFDRILSSQSHICPHLYESHPYTRVEKSSFLMVEGYESGCEGRLFNCFWWWFFLKLLFECSFLCPRSIGIIHSFSSITVGGGAVSIPRRFRVPLWIDCICWFYQHKPFLPIYLSPLLNTESLLQQQLLQANIIVLTLTLIISHSGNFGKVSSEKQSTRSFQ